MGACCKIPEQLRFKMEEYKEITLTYCVCLGFHIYILKITYFQLNCSSKFIDISEKQSVMLPEPKSPLSRSNIV